MVRRAGLGLSSSGSSAYQRGAFFVAEAAVVRALVVNSQLIRQAAAYEAGEVPNQHASSKGSTGLCNAVQHSCAAVLVGMAKQLSPAIHVVSTQCCCGLNASKVEWQGTDAVCRTLVAAADSIPAIIVQSISTGCCFSAWDAVDVQSVSAGH